MLSRTCYIIFEDLFYTNICNLLHNRCFKPCYLTWIYGYITSYDVAFLTTVFWYLCIMFTWGISHGTYHLYFVIFIWNLGTPEFIYVSMKHMNSYMKKSYEFIVYMNSYMNSYIWIHIHMNSYNHYMNSYMKWLYEFIYMWIHMWNEYMNSWVYEFMCMNSNV